jgi:hypothetical protein
LTNVTYSLSPPTGTVPARWNVQKNGMNRDFVFLPLHDSKTRTPARGKLLPKADL